MLGMGFLYVWFFIVLKRCGKNFLYSLFNLNVEGKLVKGNGKKDREFLKVSWLVVKDMILVFL